jgi:hypothetical protein
MPDGTGAPMATPDPVLNPVRRTDPAPVPAMEAARVEVDGRLVICAVTPDLKRMVATVAGEPGHVSAPLTPLLAELARQAVEGVPARTQAAEAEIAAARTMVDDASADIEIDDDATASETDGAVWVSAWVRVPRARLFPVTGGR